MNFFRTVEVKSLQICGPIQAGAIAYGAEFKYRTQHMLQFYCMGYCFKEMEATSHFTAMSINVDFTNKLEVAPQSYRGNKYSNGIPVVHNMTYVFVPFSFEALGTGMDPAETAFTTENYERTVTPPRENTENLF